MALPLRLGKKKKHSTDDALRRVNDLLAQKPLSKPMRRKRRKPTRFEITTDPRTGLRDFKGTYNPASRASSSQGLNKFDFGLGFKITVFILKYKIS
jgi:hypothetical protein